MTDVSPDGQAARHAPAPVENPLGNLPLLLALVLTGLEALLLVGVAVWSIVDMVRGGFDGAAVSIALTVVLLLFVLLLLVGINALWQGRRWGRGPVLTWQLIQLAIGLGAIGIAPLGAILPLIAISVAVGIGLLLPASVRATSRPSAPSSGTVL